MSLKQLLIMIIIIGLIYNYINLDHLDHLQWRINNFELIFVIISYIMIFYIMIVYIIYCVPWMIIYTYILIAN